MKTTRLIACAAVAATFAGTALFNGAPTFASDVSTTARSSITSGVGAARPEPQQRAHFVAAVNTGSGAAVSTLNSNTPGVLAADGGSTVGAVSGSSFAVKGAAGAAAISTSAAGGFSLSSGDSSVGTLSIKPVGVDTTATKGQVVAGDAVVYADTDKAADTVVRPTATGIETFTQLRGRSAPESYSWTVDLPGNQKLLRQPDGGINVVNGAGSTVASVLPPWAKDADNKAVPVSFSVSGSTLTMTVAHHTGNFAYPIIADPLWYWHYTRCYTAAQTNWEIRTFGHMAALAAAGGTVSAAIALGFTPSAPITGTIAAVLGVGSAAYWMIANEFAYALSQSPRLGTCLNVGVARTAWWAPYRYFAISHR
jgi:hypothetical protein